PPRGRDGPRAPLGTPGWRRGSRRPPPPHRRSHGSTHKRGPGCLRATPCHTKSESAVLAPAWPSCRALVGASESVPELPGSTPISCSPLVRAHPEPGLLSSPAITQGHRSYEPLRLLSCPPPGGDSR